MELDSIRPIVVSVSKPGGDILSISDLHPLVATADEFHAGVKRDAQSSPLLPDGAPTLGIADLTFLTIGNHCFKLRCLSEATKDPLSTRWLVALRSSELSKACQAFLVSSRPPSVWCDADGPERTAIFLLAAVLNIAMEFLKYGHVTRSMAGYELEAYSNAGASEASGCHSLN